MNPEEGFNPRPADTIARQHLADLLKRSGLEVDRKNPPERLEFEVWGKREVWIREGSATGTNHLTYRMERDE